MGFSGRSSWFGRVMSSLLLLSRSGILNGQIVPEPDNHRAISYDLTGAKLSDQLRAGCGMRATQKEIFDSKGRRVELISYRDDGTVGRHVLFSYDFRGWLIDEGLRRERGPPDKVVLRLRN